MTISDVDFFKLKMGLKPNGMYLKNLLKHFTLNTVNKEYAKNRKKKVDKTDKMSAKREKIHKN